MQWNMKLGIFRIREIFFTKQISKLQNRVSSEVVESPSLGIFKRNVDVALRDMD